MTPLVRVALRNLVRQRRRTMVTAAALAIGTAAALLLSSFRNEFLRFLVRDAIESQAGAFQVQKEGAFAAVPSNPLALRMERTDEVQRVLSSVPGVRATAPRLRFPGVLSNGRASAPVLAVALDPMREEAVCPKFRNRWSDASGAPAAGLSPEQPRGIVVGRELADGLRLSVGDSVTLTAQTAAGAVNALDAVVTAFAGSFTPFEGKRAVIVSLEFGRELTGLPDGATELAVSTASLEAIAPAAAAASTALGDGFDVHRWDEVVAFVRDAVIRLNIMVGIVSTVLLVLVSAGIMNTMLMATYERFREVGTMMALGLRRNEILRLFLFEATFLWAFGLAAGLLLGGGLVFWMNAAGISFHAPGGGPPGILRPYVLPSFVAAIAALSLASTLVAAFIPAWRASRLRPVEALAAR